MCNWPSLYHIDCARARHVLCPRWLIVLVLVLAACAPLAPPTAEMPTTAPTLAPTNAPTRTPTMPPSATPSATPTATATSSPTATPTRTAIRTPAPTHTPTAAPLPARVTLDLTHEYQKLNNCGPVSLGVVASYFGIARNQLQIAPVVKGGDTDKNVGPAEMQAYLESLGLRAIVRVNGTPEALQRLLAARLPVIVHQWLLKSNGELVGHYRVVQGYDRAAAAFVTSDPFVPPRKSYSAADFERFWQPWNHRYIVAYRAEQEPLVRALLADDFDVQQNARRALAAASENVKRNPSDVYEHYNLGDDRLALGDAEGAVRAYEQAFALGLPPHFYWYNFGPLDAYLRVGKFQRVLDWTAPMLKEAGNVEEIRYWRGKAYLALGQKQKAREEFSLAVQFNPRYADAQAMLAQAQ